VENIPASQESSAQPKERLKLGYAEAFILSLILMFIGFTCEILVSGKGIGIPEFPFNLIALLIFTNLIAFTHIFLRNHRIIKWLSSVPVAVSAMSMLTVLILIMGMILQDDEKSANWMRIIGISHVASSIPFFICQIYLLFTLGLVIMKRFGPINKRNIGFTLNHLGLWITIAFASMGSGDLKRLTLNLETGSDFTNIAFDEQNNAFPLKTSFKLNSISIEEYHPKLITVEMATNKVLTNEAHMPQEVYAGFKTNQLGWDIFIEKYIKSAKESDSTFISYNELGAVSAAFVLAKKGNEIKKGWITAGNFIVKRRFLPIDEQFCIAMNMQEAKSIRSEIEYITKYKRTGIAHLEVNKPYKIDGWNIYQVSYDKQMGRWSRISGLELINDPWLPFVYIGLFMMLTGAVYIFWVGNHFKPNSKINHTNSF